MKILIIRHGDPDYSIDSLTEKGWKEAEYLSEKMHRYLLRHIMYRPLEGQRIRRPVRYRRREGRQRSASG